MLDLQLDLTLTGALVGAASPPTVEQELAEPLSKEEYLLAYPPHAREHGISGRAVLECRIGAEGRATDCAIAFESPAGEGFGAASLKIASRLRVRPTDQARSVADIAGKKTWIPVEWPVPPVAIPSDPVAPARTLADLGPRPTALVAPKRRQAYGAWLANRVLAADTAAFSGCATPELQSLGEAGAFGAGSHRAWVERVRVLGCPGGGRTHTLLVTAAKTGWTLHAGAGTAPPLAEIAAPDMPSLDLIGVVPPPPAPAEGILCEPRSRIELAVYERPPTLIWLKRPDPDGLDRYYPPSAKERGVEGRAVVDCLVGASGTLTDCRVARETPADMAFGNASLRITRSFQAAPVQPDGHSIAGKRLQFAVRWSLSG